MADRPTASIPCLRARDAVKADVLLHGVVLRADARCPFVRDHELTAHSAFPSPLRTRPPMISPRRPDLPALSPKMPVTVHSNLSLFAIPTAYCLAFLPQCVRRLRLVRPASGARRG